MMMGVEKMPPPRNRKMVPAENYGVKLISTAFLMKPDQALIWRGPMLHSAISQLLVDVDWGELDYLIVDMPPGTGDAQLTLAQLLPLSGAVIVTQPMQVAASDALRGLKTFEKLEVPIIGVVENMSGEFFGTGAGEKLAH
jgi:ATP-binding protein involved in chromosome partitioning